MIRPDDNSDKKARVEGMFDDIAPTYDALNHLLSLGIDRRWRRKVVKMVKNGCADDNSGQKNNRISDVATGTRVLDVATGTGDMAIALARRLPDAHITGVDISEGMLARGREKVSGRGLDKRVGLRTGDAEALGFAGATFDAVTVAFGVRNFGDIAAGLGEMCRVLRPGGRCFVLEFSEPTAPLFGWVYRFYFHRVLPWMGRLVSRNGAAYSYLPRSVDAFPPPGRFCEMLHEAGFASVRTRKLTFGVAYIYESVKI